MTKLTAKFVNADGGTLRIFASPSKRGGVRVAATLKLSGQPAQTGCRQSFENGADAIQRLEGASTEAGLD
jgi:hypothetical protein